MVELYDNKYFGKKLARIVRFLMRERNIFYILE